VTDFDDITEPLPQRLTEGLLRLGTALRSQSWRRATELGITPTQMEILILLQHRPRPQMLKALVEQTALTTATVSDAVKALAAKGLLQKGKVEDDKRAVAISLTEAGAAVAKQAGDWSHFLAEAAQSLPETEQLAFLQAVIGLIRTLQERDQIPVTRMCVSCRHFQPYRHPDGERPHHCGLVDAPFGQRHLRLDCAEHEVAEPDLAQHNWAAYARVIPLTLPGRGG